MTDEATPTDPAIAGGDATSSDSPAAIRRRRRLWLTAFVLVVIGLTYCGWRTWRAAHAGTLGRTELIEAEADLEAHRLGPAREHLLAAKAHFSRMDDNISGLGPILPLAKLVPVLRQQVRGAEAFSDAGLLLSDAGLRLDDAASGILEPADQHLQVAVAIDTLKKVEAAMADGVKSLDKAASKVRSLNGYNLFGPLGKAQADLARRLPTIETKARGAESGLRALVDFAGGSGPRRYLVLSQNPDEPRPTGGFIGTYGLLIADGTQLKLDRYASIESWTHAHPETAIPPDQAGVVFQLQAPPVAQTLGNVNTTPDWPAAAQLAMSMWQKGGEQPVDGVVSFTPGLLGRILEVTGPVNVPDFGDTVSSGNLQERLDFHTHNGQPADDPNRKDFVASLAHVTLQRLLDSPASDWDQLAQAVAKALNSQQAMAWTRDADLSSELARHRWDLAFPPTRGDFFTPAEFSYSAKNGRGLKRVFDHDVQLRPDGSARITTTITINNTEPADINTNPDSLSYISVYGPANAAFVDSDTDQPVLPVATLAGHPAGAWFRAAQPMGSVTLKVTWDAPDIAHKTSDGTWVYNLWWRRVVDHDGDSLNLHVHLPKGWKWKGPSPPEHTDLNQDFVNTWTISS